MSEEKTQEKPTLFTEVLALIGAFATKEKVTLPTILGQLRLIEHHLISSVVSKASERAEGDDTQEQKDASPAVGAGTA